MAVSGLAFRNGMGGGKHHVPVSFGDLANSCPREKTRVSEHPNTLRIDPKYRQEHTVLDDRVGSRCGDGCDV